MATFSTALLRMVVLVEGQEGVVGVMVGVGVVVRVVARSTTLLTISSARFVSPAVMLAAGLAVVTEGAVTGAEVEAMVLSASKPSKMEEGLNPAASISGSQTTRIGAITNNLEKYGVESQARR